MKAELISPVSVTDNAVGRSIDIIYPRLRATGHQRVVFHAGVQINGTPHLGTNVMQTAAFLLAKAAASTFSIDAVVRFGALDNAPYQTRVCPETGRLYHLSHYHALGEKQISKLVDAYYRGFFDLMTAATGIHYEIESYTSQQGNPLFRTEFLATISAMESLRWVLAPSHGKISVKIPCPVCGWVEKNGESTRLLAHNATAARLSAVCIDHGSYEAAIAAAGSAGYVDLTTLHRNFVKERAASRDRTALSVMVKGADWAPGCQLLDEAFMQLPGLPPPPRIFTPVVLSDSGAKLSKSLIREGRAGVDSCTPAWMLDASRWERSTEDYVHMLVRLVSLMLSEPKHFDRGYTTREISRLLAALPAGVTAEA